jgi:DNA modification methylase
MSKAKQDSTAGRKIHRIANQTIIYGNSQSLREVDDDSVQLIVTSPPYWDLKKYGKKEHQIGAEDYETYIQRMNTVWEECYRVAADGGVLVINVNSRRNKGIFYPLAFDIYKAMTKWKLWDVNIWYIPNALPQCNHYMERLFDNKFEYLMVFIKGSSEKYKFRKPRVPQKYIHADPRAHKKNARGRCLGNIFRIPAYRPPNVKQLGYHEAAFPEELASLMIETYTTEGDKVLDPFLGSGTTLKVCNIMNRVGFGYELNDGYQELVEKRIKEHWVVPDWKKIDVIHSTTMKTGMVEERKIHFVRNNGLQTEFLKD